MWCYFLLSFILIILICGGIDMTKLKNAFFLFIAVLSNLMCDRGNTSSEWPIQGWHISTPEERGMDPDSLLTLSKKLAARNS